MTHKTFRLSNFSFVDLPIQIKELYDKVDSFASTVNVVSISIFNGSSFVDIVVWYKE